MRIAHTHGNFTRERAAALGMLPELIKPKVVAALIGTGRLQHGCAQGHVPDRLHINPLQYGFHIFRINGQAAFSGLKPEEADAERRIHLNGAGQLSAGPCFFSDFK